MADEWNAAATFDALANPTAREILVHASGRELTAEELAERCDVSLPTVYRHVETLADCSLLTERTNVDAEGNHYKTVETTVEEFRIEVSPDGFDLAVEQRREDLVDRFEGLWSDLETGGSDE